MAKKSWAEADRKKCAEAKQCHLEWGNSGKESQRGHNYEEWQKSEIEERLEAGGFTRSLEWKGKNKARKSADAVVFWAFKTVSEAGKIHKLKQQEGRGE